MRQQLLVNLDLQAMPDLFARDLTKVSHSSILGIPLSEFASSA